jgi:ribonuclease P protein component
LNQTFHKDERLRSKKLTNKLFSEGSLFYVYPFRVQYLRISAASDYPARFLVSVSKRYFRKAIDRNRIKRLVREACRKNKQIMISKQGSAESQLLIGMIYTAKTILTYADIERKIILILQRLIEQDEQAAG